MNLTDHPKITRTTDRKQDTLKSHPLADAFPMMSEAEFDGLKKDIAEHGLRHPVITFEGMILDGRNRKSACQDLGLACPEAKFEDRYPGVDPAEFVASENIHRRHMTQAQLTIAAEKLATALAGRPRKTVSADTDSSEEAHHAVTVKEAARLTGAAEPSVRKVRKVRKDAVPEVQEAMDRGDITPTAAVNLSRRPKAEQSEIMATVPLSQIPTVAATVTPIGEAPSLNPAGGRVGPKVVLTRQMNLSDLTMIQKVVKDWAENEAVITDLDETQLKKFLADLRKSRTAYTRLIELIQLKTKTEAPATPRSNGGDKGAQVPTEPPVKVAAKKAAAAPKTPVKKAAAAPKTPATPGSPAARKTAAKKTASAPVKAASAPVKAAETSPDGESFNDLMSGLSSAKQTTDKDA